jgi:hypothetical protein
LLGFGQLVQFKPCWPTFCYLFIALNPTLYIRYGVC